MAENTRGQGRRDLENDNRKSRSSEELTSSNRDHQNASANRGGTTDMGSEAMVNRSNPGSGRGSGITTKRSVTGSDYDGQVSE